MTPTDSMAPDFLFLAFIASIILIIFLQTRSIVKQQTTHQTLEETQDQLAALNEQVETMTGNREQLAEAVQKTQENLVMMFMALEESKYHAGIQPEGPILEGVKKRFAGILEQSKD
ncbi:MAG: hypothetical protein HC792_03575 [Acaryochloridaceae cyanobacterium CSU_5_19]|nr:hypothetical protein [Acaryochloridaceae cyanobacterium CSU_5_19]